MWEVGLFLGSAIVIRVIGFTVNDYLTELSLVSETVNCITSK